VIAGALYELARNHQIQSRLRDEINEKMPTDEQFDYDNIMSLEYLDQIWHETLRLHLPAGHFARICTEAVTIDGLKDKPLSFDVGDTVYLAASSVFKDPEFFENPNDFDPERFSPQNGGVKMFTDRGVFFPFGMGPRNCPGSRFAIAQVNFIKYY
jgi:cytochrome P450 family 6/cytochrome P450 family 28